MNIVVLNVFNVSSISVMSKSCKPSSVKVCSQRSVTCHKAINSHVKFLASNQQRINDIALHDIGLSLRAFRFPPEIVFPLSDLLQFVKQEDSLSLRFGDRLHNPPYGSSSLLEFFDKQRVITWEVIGSRIEVITIGQVNNI